MFLINFHILTCLLLLNGNFLKTLNLSKSPGTHAYNSWKMYACGLSFSVKTHISQPVIMEKHWIMGQKVWIWGWFSTNKILYRGNQSIVVPHLWNSWLSWPSNCENHMKLYNKQYKYKRLSPTKYKTHSSIYHFKVHLLKAYNEQTKQNCLCLLKRKMSGSQEILRWTQSTLAASISHHTLAKFTVMFLCVAGVILVFTVQLQLLEVMSITSLPPQ